MQSDTLELGPKLEPQTPELLLPCFVTPSDPPPVAAPGSPHLETNHTAVPQYDVATDHQFPEFLTTIIDSHGFPACVVWYLSPLASVSIYCGACVVNQYSKSVQAYAIVRDFVSRDLTHVLFRIQIKAWLTRGTVCKPGCDTYSFLLVPSAMARPAWSGAFRNFLSCSETTPLTTYVHRVAESVQWAITSDSPDTLTDEPITRAFLTTYLACPHMRYFSSIRDTAVTVHRANLELSLNYYLPPFPLDYDPEWEEPAIVVPCEDGARLLSIL